MCYIRSLPKHRPDAHDTISPVSLRRISPQDPCRGWCFPEHVKVSKNGQELEWSYVKLVETRMGSDGLVRSARIKLHNTELERPIVKLCVLEEAAHADN